MRGYYTTFCRLANLRAAGIFGGLWRATFSRAVRAKHTTITGERTQNSLAILAFVKENALISRHHLGFLMAAFGTGNGRFKRGAVRHTS
jgi:hypothetical protein